VARRRLVRLRVRGLCRDLVNQRASELVIAISDGESGPGKISATSAPYLERNKMGCWKYEGMAKARSNVAEVSGRWMDVTSNVTWQLDPRDTGLDAISPVFPNTLRAGLMIKVPIAGRDLVAEADYTAKGCKASGGPASFSIPAMPLATARTS